MALKHSVYDTDTHFVIDPVTRTMKNEGSGKSRLIVGDHNSERFTFQIPKTIEGHDMTACDKVEVHFTNTCAKTKQESCDFTSVDDLQVSQEDDNVAIFSWLVKRTATKYEGTLDISVVFICTDENGDEIYTWSTFPCSNIAVAKGQRNNSAIVEDSIDILEQWRKELFEMKPKLFLRYAENSNGDGFTETWSIGKNYIGLSVGTTAPTDPTDYTWLLFKGENGLTPHIDKTTGHWFIGTTDTGYLAGVYEGGTTPDPDPDPDPDPNPDPDPDPDIGGGGTTPSACIMYYGSMMTSNAINATNIKNKCTGSYSTSATAQFKSGCDRFVIAFQSAYGSLKVTNTDPTFGGDATSLHEYYGALMIDGIKYEVYVRDANRPLSSGYPLAISIS